MFKVVIMMYMMGATGPIDKPHVMYSDTNFYSLATCSEAAEQQVPIVMAMPNVIGVMTACIAVENFGEPA